MRVEMTFNPAAVPEGYTIGNVYHTVKTEFMKHGLRCCSDGDVLAFEDNGREDDFANMWNVIKCLMVSKWYLQCATSCDYIEDGEREDVLSQAYLFKARRVV